MASSPTKRSTRKLSEVARHLVVPSGIVTTGYPQVLKRCLQMGTGHDAWQQGLGRAILGKRKDGKYAATVGGIVLSIPRQVGKTYTVGSILFALAVDNPGMTIIWTAHRTRTSNETFNSMRGMARRSKVKPFVAWVRATNGEQEIRFHNTSRILFGAREQGFGRGFAEVDVIVFDEAQILTSRALEDMVAATNQARHPAGALLFYMGTPPRPGIDPGEAFTAKRAKALSGSSEDLLYVELSADPDASPDDREQVMKANPSVPDRTPWESIHRLRENLPDIESYMREGMGIWPDDDGGGFFLPGKWLAGVDKGSAVAGPLALGVAVSVDRKRAVVAVAGLNGAGKVHLEPVWFGSPAAAPVEVQRLAAEHSAVAVAIDGAGPGADMVPTLQQLIPGPVLRVMKLDDVKVASSEVYDLVEAVGHAHLDDPDLNGAVRVAVRKDVGDRFVIGRRKSSADVSTFEAAALAAWAVGRSKTYNVLDSVL